MGDLPRSGWRHQLVRVDNRGRIPLGDAVEPGARLTGRLAGRRWVLRVEPEGPHRVDARGRVTVPAGTRWLLGGVDAGVSWIPDLLVVVWPAAAADALVGDLAI